MASPFSPFKFKFRKDATKRQSQIPSELIDWDAPVMPEVERQRIVYETHIKDLNDQFAIESLIKEQIYDIAFEAYKEELQTYKSNQLADAESKISLLLGQLKMAKNVENEKMESLKNQLIHFKRLAKKRKEDQENFN